MGVPYAEVIGDPIAHSKSPLIHKFWLEKLGIEGDYRTVRVTREGLADYLQVRREDPDWRGCNVTMPLKASVRSYLDRESETVATTRAANLITREDSKLSGHNSDIAGVAAALMGVGIRSAMVCIIGGGGAARAALAFLEGYQPTVVKLLVREPTKVMKMLSFFPPAVEVLPLCDPAEAMCSADILINATPMGMNGGPAMLEEVIDWLSHLHPAATVFDMVYAPSETHLLQAATAIGYRSIGGAKMLAGQAAESFEGFYGVRPPPLHEPDFSELFS